MRAWIIGWCVVAGLDCGGRVAAVRESSPPPAEAPVAPAEDEAAPVRHISSGVLHGLMIEGDLRVQPDEALAAELAAAGDGPFSARIEVCLDPGGLVTRRLRSSSGAEPFDRAALAVVDRWRFRPYQDGGAAMPACSHAQFDYGTMPGGGDRPARALDHDALAPAEVELPPSVPGRLRTPGRERMRAPVPGVALAWACWRSASMQAPEVVLFQSSGDEQVDRSLLTRRLTRPADETTELPVRCTTLSAFVKRPTQLAGPAPGPPPGPPALPPPPGGAPAAFEAQRVAGDRNIFPADDIKVLIARSGRNRFVVRVKVCVDTVGRVSSADILESSRYVGFDADLINGIATWRYSPFTVNGVPAPACGLVNFAYSQT